MATYAIAIYEDGMETIEVFTPKARNPVSAIKKALLFNCVEDDYNYKRQKEINDALPETIEDLIKEVWSSQRIRIGWPVVLK